ncbi:MAG: response regulator [Fibrobacteria bacterium]|nr:response regulator [Fibrobacteria bacterium]
MSDPLPGRILFVDDEQGIRDMLARHFRFQGYEVLRASDGIEALEILDREPVDVVVTDLVMPRMDGVALMRALRADHPTVPFIAMTGYVELAYLLTAMRLGAEDCLFKPIEDLSELEKSVAHLVERSRRWQRKLAQLRSVSPEAA